MIEALYPIGSFIAATAVLFVATIFVGVFSALVIAGEDKTIVHWGVVALVVLAGWVCFFIWRWPGVFTVLGVFTFLAVSTALAGRFYR